MRAALVLLVAMTAAMVVPAQSGGCNCFPPEVQEKTARETLDKAKAVVYGRISGRELRVAESFKGPAVGTTMSLAAAPRPCEVPEGDEALLLVFDDAPATVCDLHPREHYLVGALRGITQRR